MKRYLVFCLFFFWFLESAAQTGARQSFTKGIYGDPGDFLKNGMSFQSLGVNALFIRSTSLTDDIVAVAKREGIKVYVEFPTLNGEVYLADHPGAWPIDQTGGRAPAADWFMGICPTDSGFREYRKEQLRSILKQYDVDGVWLDYLHWHAQFETPQPILPETCFCDECVTHFAQSKSVNIPGGETDVRARWILSNADSLWRKWRSEVVTGWVTDMKSVLKEIRPRALLGIFYCPWYPEEFGRAQYRILGLDLDALSERVDVLSPMLYHQMMDRSPAWVAEYVQWLKQTKISDGLKPRIWPIVQAHNKPGVITTEEFRNVMWNGSRSPASGIMMFTLHSLIGETGKLEVMKDLYRKRK